RSAPAGCGRRSHHLRRHPRGPRCGPFSGARGKRRRHACSCTARRCRLRHHGRRGRGLRGARPVVGPGGTRVILSRGKKNRRRKVPTKAKGTLLKSLPRPRLPRGRKAVLLACVLVLAALAVWPLSRAYHNGAVLTVARLEVTGNRHWSSSRLLAH